ncbi:MAG: response regulator [Bryobacteraceae bacterium]
MFRILVVDDNPGAVYLLREVMKSVHRRHELHFAKDGLDALDFLHCRGAYVDAPRPNLILLDMNMPRLSGLETLSAIKNDPELCVIPVIMLSTENSPQKVRNCYRAHANCYVQKPIDLDRSVKLAQAIEAFWMDFALLPSGDGRSPENLPSTDYSERDFGPRIANKSVEVRSARTDNSPAKAETITQSRRSECEEHNRLLDGFGAAVQELLSLHEQLFLAIVEGDTESPRFDLLIHMANEKKQSAKYGYLRHVEAHGCSNRKCI